jgi:hypothetical protein
MIELVALVCLASSPSDCREERIGFLDGGTLQGCVFAAQPTAAKWIGEHPKYEIKRIECRRAMEEA